MHIRNFNKLLENFRNLKKFSGIKLKSVNDIKNIPSTTRDELASFNIRNCPVKPVNITATSGSIGSRLIIYQSKRCYEMHVKRLIKIFKIAGLTKNDIFLNLNSYSLNGPGRIIDTALKRFGLTCIPFGVLNNERDINLVAGFIKKMKPSVIGTYPNQVFQLFNAIGRNHSISKCIVQGELLLPEFKKEIEKISGVNILDFYGSNEFSGFAIHENPKDEFLRLVDDGLYIELIKDRKESGEGKLVITDLYNYSMPFVRYILGDIVRIKKNKGKTYIKPLGRKDDYININGEVESKKRLIGMVFNILRNPDFFILIDKNRRTYNDFVSINISEKDWGKNKEIEKSFGNEFSFSFRIRKTNRKVPRTRSGKFTHVIDLRRLNLVDKKFGW